MAAELSRTQRAGAIASLQRYFEENMPEPLGDLAAGLLLDFFLAEIGPISYNLAIADAQTRLLQRVQDLNGELFEDELRFWPRHDAKRRKNSVGKR